MRNFLLGCASLAITIGTPAFAAVPVESNNFESGFSPAGQAGFTTQGNVKIAQGSDYTTNGNTFGGTGASLSNHFVTFGSGNGVNHTPNAGSLTSFTIDTVAGLNYIVNFDYGVIGSAIDQTLGFAITSANSTLFNVDLSLTGSNNLDTVFHNYQQQFTGTGGAVTFSFLGEGARNDNSDTLLDNFGLRSGAVPEASTWAMMLLGFGGAGMAMRARRRNGINSGLVLAGK